MFDSYSNTKSVQAAHSVDADPSFVPVSPTLDTQGYRLTASGPAVEDSEVELVDCAAAEIVIRWGSSVLSVAHVVPPNDFYVGEQFAPSERCGFSLPSTVLGSRRLALVVWSGAQASVAIPAQAIGFVRSASGEVLALDAIRSVATDLDASGQCRVSLPRGASVRFELGGCVFHVAGVAAGRPTRRGLFSGDWSSAPYFGLSLALHAGIVGVLAFLTPALGLADEDELQRDRLYTLQQYLDGAAERERLSRESPESGAVAEAAGNGARAEGAEGALGNPSVTATNRRYQVQGRKDNPDPHVSRMQMLQEVGEFGMVGLLRSADGSLAPTSPWGRDTALGTSDVSAQGNMWGDAIGEAFGYGGLGMSGPGQGSGGPGGGIGLGDSGIGSGFGPNPGEGTGFSGGRLGGTRTPRPVGKLRMANTIVSGRLPSEVIQRVVRQNFGRFRLCYTQGLSRNPNLEGRIAARFVIARDGSVSAVSNGGSDLPDSAVTSCVLSAFYGLSFPQPEAGIVTVVYPILLSPG